MTQVPEAGYRILEYLVQHMKDGIIVGNHATYVGYKEIHDALRLTRLHVKYGESLKQQGLEELANWTKDENHPAITGLIVDRQKKRPGDGYFTLFDKNTSAKKWWHDEVKKSENYKWSLFLRYSPLEPLPETPEAADIEEPLPGRVKVTKYRILRDTALARLIKELYDHKCQLCRTPLKLHDGKNYAEAHHIKPLGGSDPGPDSKDNIICVCPNCHAQCDMGAIALDAVKLSTEFHRINPTYVAHHNEKIWKGRPVAQ
jgi:HNH endonuclease